VVKSPGPLTEVTVEAMPPAGIENGFLDLLVDVDVRSLNNEVYILGST
jgi:hypothetical protein